MTPRPSRRAGTPVPLVALLFFVVVFAAPSWAQVERAAVRLDGMT